MKREDSGFESGLPNLQFEKKGKNGITIRKLDISLGKNHIVSCETSLQKSNNKNMIFKTKLLTRDHAVVYFDRSEGKV
jgi:hypothetical protein